MPANTLTRLILRQSAVILLHDMAKMARKSTEAITPKGEGATGKVTLVVVASVQ
jgi:hypothetical protein